MRDWWGRLLFVVLAIGGTVAWCIGKREPARPWIHLQVAVVDYTVPFDNFKEHSGLFWVLNHMHVVSPGGMRAWLSPIDYIGFYPVSDRPPERLAQRDLGDVELLYLADTYGVYRDDVATMFTRSAHNDHNPMLFGGLSRDDAESADRFVSRGGILMVEFNSFCEPTAMEARRIMEGATGVEWSGWVGRTFADMGDENDVPRWLPREFMRQFPRRALPRKPVLVLVNRHGRLKVFEAPQFSGVTPHLVMTAEGNMRLGFISAPMPYYYWFPLVRARPGTRVLARWQLPAAVTNFAVENNIDLSPPAMTETMRGLGTTYYMAGDFADIDFEPGSTTSVSPVVQKLMTAYEERQSSAPIYWNFYVPMMQRLLGEAR